MTTNFRIGQLVALDYFKAQRIICKQHICKDRGRCNHPAYGGVKMAGHTKLKLRELCPAEICVFLGTQTMADGENAVLLIGEETMFIEIILLKTFEYIEDENE